MNGLVLYQHRMISEKMQGAGQNTLSMIPFICFYNLLKLNT